MKRGTPRHPKMKRLARALGKSLPTAVGIMEMLWHFTSEQAPRGDVGRADDEDIAEAVGWDGESPFLIECLVSCGWVDRNGTHRLIIHDWPDHADDATKKKLTRSDQKFLDCYYASPVSVQQEQQPCLDTDRELSVSVERAPPTMRQGKEGQGKEGQGKEGQGKAPASNGFKTARDILQPLPLDGSVWDAELFRKNFKEIWRGTATVLEIGCTTAMQDTAICPDPPGVAMGLTESARKWVGWYKARGINRNLVDWLKEDSMSDPPEIRHAPGSKAARDAEMDQMARARGLIT